MFRSFVRAAFVAGVSTLAVAFGAAAQAERAEPTAEAFGARQSILDITLSPSGDKLAFVGAGEGHSEVLNIVNLAGDMAVKRVFSATEANSDLAYCDWATDERLVCSVRVIDNSQGRLIGFSRLIAVDADGSDPVILTPRMSSRSLALRQYGGGIVALDVPGEDGKILMSKQYVKERSVGTRFANDQIGLGVESIDVEDGRSRTVETPDPDAIAYFSDEEGRIRMKVRQPMEGSTGYLSDRQLYYFRPASGGEWQKLSEISVDSQTTKGTQPLAIDGRRNVAYAVETIDGYDALVALPLDGSSDRRVVMARDDVDVDHLIRIGRQRRVVGGSYASEKRMVEYFDGDLANLAVQLHDALPGQPLINIVGANADESKLLIVASGDTNPGMVYLFNKNSGELNELLPVRRQLSDREMAPMKSVSFSAADGTSIPAYLTLPLGSDGKDLPAIVLPHGGPSARDEWGFDWLVQFFAARGYAVLQPNYRGSAGYGTAWFGKNGFQAWKTAIGDVDDAGKWLIEQGIARPESLAIVGWSYGGYAALQSQVLDPGLYKAVVAVAPVTDLELLRQESEKYVDGRLVKAFIGEGQHVIDGSPARHADMFQAPVLMFHGTLDQNVDVDQSRLMARKLKDAGKQVDYVEFDGLAHGLSDSDARATMLTDIDEFLAKAIK